MKVDFSIQMKRMGKSISHIWVYYKATSLLWFSLVIVIGANDISVIFSHILSYAAE